MTSRFVLSAFIVLAACDSEGSRGYQECPPNASCAPPCQRGRVVTCVDEYGCSRDQVYVDRCLEGYGGHCTCEDPGDRCAKLDCAAGSVCYDGQCLKRQKCGDDSCEPDWGCFLSRFCVQTVATKLSHPVAIQVGGDQLYVANAGTTDRHGQWNGDANVSVVSVNGGDVTRLAESSSPIYALAMDDAQVYWVSGAAPAQLRRVSRGGADSAVVVDDVQVWDALAVDEGRVYWLDRRGEENPARLMSAAVSGDSSPMTLWTRDDVSRGPIIADGRVAWIEGSRTLWRANRDGTDIMGLGSPEARSQQLTGIASDGSTLFLSWTSFDTNGVSTYLEDDERFKVLGTMDRVATPRRSLSMPRTFTSLRPRRSSYRASFSARASRAWTRAGRGRPTPR